VIRACAIALVLLVACKLDTSGTGAPSNMLGTVGSSGTGDAPLDTGGDDTTSTSAATLGDASVDGSDEASSAAADSSDDASHSSTGDPTQGTTGPVDECADPPLFAVQIPANEAVVVAPMIHDEVGNGTPYVVSDVENMGTATFTFDVPCPDEYYFHGFVYDGALGPVNLAFQDNGADSYAVDVGGQSAVWHYGCQMAILLAPRWQWQPIMNNLNCVMNDDLVIAPLLAGTHTIEFLNRETGTNAQDDPGSAAAIAVLTVTNDPSYVP